MKGDKGHRRHASRPQDFTGATREPGTTPKFPATPVDQAEFDKAFDKAEREQQLAHAVSVVGPIFAKCVKAMQQEWVDNHFGKKP